MKEIVIEPKKGLFQGIDLKELYDYRELTWVLALKEIKIRYKQTLIGGLWAIIVPLLTMLIFTVFFGQMLDVPSDGVPYPIFSYSGLLLWTYFTISMTISSNSLVANSHLVTKVYFPRLIIPISSTLIGILDYTVASIVLFGLMVHYTLFPSLSILLLPVILFFTWMLATGIGFWLSAIMVKYRDVKFIVPFFTSLFIYITPVIYPISAVGNYKWILMFNPMAGLIEAHRSILLGHQVVDLNLFFISIALSLIIFLSGAMYFQKVERYFADII